MVRQGHWAFLQIWATMKALDFVNHAAKALRVLCCLNIVVSILASALNIFIYLTRVCEATDLFGLVHEIYSE